jgi:hypothetical protein
MVGESTSFLPMSPPTDPASKTTKKKASKFADVRAISRNIQSISTQLYDHVPICGACVPLRKQSPLKKHSGKQALLLTANQNSLLMGFIISACISDMLFPRGKKKLELEFGPVIWA